MLPQTWRIFHGGGIWPFDPMPACDGSNPRDAKADFEHDLQAIGIDYVDLVLLHWTCDTPQETLRTWRILESFAISGKARAIGVSNFNASDLDELVSAAEIKPAVIQVGQAIGSPHNVTLGRDLGTMKRAHELGITYQAYGSLGEPHATAPVSCIDILHDPTVMGVAQRHNRSTVQVAYRWHLEQGNVVVAKSANPDHMRSDLEVFDFNLSAEDMAELNALSCDSPQMV